MEGQEETGEGGADGMGRLVGPGVERGGAQLSPTLPRPRGCVFLFFCFSCQGWGSQEAFLLLHHPDTSTCYVRLGLGQSHPLSCLLETLGESDPR